MKRNKKGFTLVELVIVIAVIAILAAVLLPTFSNVIENSKESSRYQQAVNAEKELFGDGYLPEDTVGFVIGVNYNGNHYYQIQEGHSLQKIESVDETYLHLIDDNEISNNKVHVYTYNIEENIATLKIGGAIVNITDSNFNTYFNYSGNTLTVNSTYASTIEEIVFPESFNYNSTTISSYILGTWGAFSDINSFSNSLKKVTIPENVVLDSSACGLFANSSVDTIIFEGNRTALPNMLFFGNESITTITIPSCVNFIGPGCFCSCSNLQSIIFEQPYGWTANGGWPPMPSDFSDPVENANFFVNCWSEVTHP